MSDQVARAVTGFSRRVYIILALLFVVQVGTGGLSVYLLFKDHDRAVAVASVATATARVANADHDRSIEVARVVAQIQRERARNTRAACEDTNTEHRANRDFIAATIPPSRLNDPRVKVFLRLARRSYPISNCDKVVAEKVKRTDP